MTGGTITQFLTTKPNSGRVPPVGHQSLSGAPEDQLQQQVMPSPLSLTLLHHQQKIHQLQHLQSGSQVPSQLGKCIKKFQVQEKSG